MTRARKVARSRDQLPSERAALRLLHFAIGNPAELGRNTEIRRSG
jgi:hypothetical protein